MSDFCPSEEWRRGQVVIGRGNTSTCPSLTGSGKFWAPRRTRQVSAITSSYLHLDQDDCLPLVGREVSSQSKIKIVTSDDNILKSVTSNSVLGVQDPEEELQSGRGQEDTGGNRGRSQEHQTGRQRKLGMSRGEIKEDEPLTDDK